MIKVNLIIRQVICFLLICCMGVCLAGCLKLNIEDRSFCIAGDIYDDNNKYGNFEYQMHINDDGIFIVQGNPDEVYNFDGWENIVSISVGTFNAGGIKEDGSVVVTGKKFYGNCSVDEWENIVMLEFNLYATIGLKENGIITYTGEGYMDEMPDYQKQILDEVGTWRNIVYIDTSEDCVVGVKANGRVVAVSSLHPEMSEQVTVWKNVRMVSTSRDAIVGLTNDGKVLVAKRDGYFEYPDAKKYLESYNDMEGAVKVCSGRSFVAGLMPDGTLRIRVTEPWHLWDESIEALDGEVGVIDINSYEDELVVLKKDGMILTGGYTSIQ